MEIACRVTLEPLDGKILFFSQPKCPLASSMHRSACRGAHVSGLWDLNEQKVEELLLSSGSPRSEDEQVRKNCMHWNVPFAGCLQ